MYCIAGLGNPGAEYARTRHNIGFMMLDTLADVAGVSWSAKKRATYSTAKVDDTLLVKPQNFMNDSGPAVAAALAYYRIKPAHLLVVHDDMDLPLGEYRLQFARGAAGHHGVESIIAALGTKNFWRLRVGIGRSAQQDADGKNYVLGAFTARERTVLNTTLDTLRAVVEQWRTQTH